MSENPESEFPPVESLAKRALLPALVTHPVTLLAVTAVPQLILLILNLRAWHLMSGEVNEEQKEIGILFFIGELVLLFLSVGLALWQWKKGSKSIPWRCYWLVFLPTSIYLVLFMMNLGKVIPTPLQNWIVIPEVTIFYQFVFLMPSVFLATLALACFPVRHGVGKDVGVSIGLVAGVPAFWYVLVYVASRSGIFDLPPIILFLMVTIMSLICLGGVLRILTMLFVWAMGKGQVGQCVLVGLVAILAPVAGLLLNRAIPFPADFQIWPLYVVAIGNGILLTLPRFRREMLDRTIWFLQCALFPFTVYFFLIFLPYLPLAALAIIAAGAGFLILAPTALFIIHLKRLVQNCPSIRMIPLGVIAAFLLPGYLYMEMKLDRAVLHRAIDYVYSPTPDSAGAFTGNREWLKRSLVRMQGVKHGVYLPFLTEAYEEVVLDGLVLSDEKLNRLYYTFFGEALPEMNSKAGSIFGSRSSARNFGGMSPPSPDAVLQKLTHETTTEPGEGSRTRVILELHNPSSRQAEYVTKIDLPEGVVVSGYWLHVGKERVPGQIFEKKTAMWVYRMIRDSRRDPGLLTYLSPTQLSLRVFPFAANEKRITEIEFLSPPGYLPDLKIGKEVISQESESKRQVAIKENSGLTLFLPSTDEPDLKPVKRTPYFHFIIDRSHNGLDAEAAFATIEKFSAEFPTVKEARLSVVNYEFPEDGRPLVALSEIDGDAVSQLIETLPLRGAFLSGIAMQRALFDRRELLRVGDGAAAQRYPIFVLVKGSRTVEAPSSDLVWLLDENPESDRYFVAVSGSEVIRAKNYSGGKMDPEVSPEPVLLLSSGEEIQAVPVGSSAQVVRFSTGKEARLFDEKKEEFVSFSAGENLAATSPFIQAMGLHSLEDELRWNPSQSERLLPEIVSASRESRILGPSTAYIVVENSAQWKMLERKEKEKLDGNHSLDFMESPEPQIFWVAALFFFLLALRRLFRRCDASVG